MKRLLLFWTFLLITFLDVSAQRFSANMMGQLGHELGTVLALKGFVVEENHKGFAGGPNLVVQMINDIPTQKYIQIPISTNLNGFALKSKFPEIRNGETYHFRAYETGDFVGIPSKALSEFTFAIQTSSFYFQNRLEIISGEKIEKINWKPSNFIGEMALLEGVAKNEKDIAVIQVKEEQIKLLGCKKWENSEIGKIVEVYGKVIKNESDSVYIMQNANPRLVKLEDQVGRTVSLRGRAINLNEYWWFNYRGIDIYVENMNKLPNWSGANHFQAMEITGMLEQAELPDIKQITLKKNPEKKLYYIIRNAQWKPVEGLLTPELDFRN